MDLVIKSAAVAAGKILLKYFKKELNITLKTSHKDFYTQADVEAQQAVKETILKELAKKKIPAKDIGFIGEEGLYEPGKKHVFVIDPLDGTSNFASGFDQFAVSIAYFLDGKLKAGVVFHPTSNTYYWATRGKGAYKNGRALKIAYRPLKECLIDGEISSRPHIYPRLFKLYEKIFPEVKGYRAIFCMAAACCYVADNIFNIVVNGHSYIWDIAAACLIIEEADGIMTDFKGQPLNLNPNNLHDYEVLAGHPKSVKELLRFTK